MPLTAEQEIALARRIHGPDLVEALEARDELVLTHLDMARRAARTAARRFPAVDCDDLFSEALVALVQVAERFDPETHRTRFSTFALDDIRGRLMMYATRKHRTRRPAPSAEGEPIDPAPTPLEAIVSHEDFATMLETIDRDPLKVIVML